MTGLLDSVTGGTTVGLLEPVTGLLDSVTGGTTGLTGGTTVGLLDPVTGLLDSVTGGTTVGLLDPVTGLLDSVTGGTTGLTGGTTVGLLEPVTSLVDQASSVLPNTLNMVDVPTSSVASTSAPPVDAASLLEPIQQPIVGLDHTLSAVGDALGGLLGHRA